MNKSKIDQLRQRLSRIVIRFTEAVIPESFTVSDDGDEVRQGHQTDCFDFDQRRRKGYAITIPTEKQLADAKAAGRGMQRYIKRPHDEPAARYVFAHLCTDQKNPARGEAYPPSLEDQDIEWPGED